MKKLKSLTEKKLDGSSLELSPFETENARNKSKRAINCTKQYELGLKSGPLASILT